MKKWAGMCRRGSKGIALVDDSGDRPRLRYVFDISDTGPVNIPHPLAVETGKNGTMDSVTAMLERSYNVSGNDLPQQAYRCGRQAGGGILG